MGKEYAVWFMESNSTMFLNSDSRMVHDSQGHNLYRFYNGRLLALSGQGSMAVNPDGRILNDAGNQIGFITDYARFQQEIRSAGAAGAGQPVQNGPASRSSGAASSGAGTKPSGSGTKQSGSETKPTGSGTKPSGAGTKPAGSETKPSGSGTAPSGTGTTPPPPGKPKKKSRAWLVLLAIAAIIFFVNQHSAPKETVYSDLNDAAVRLREGIVNHEDNITVKYRARTDPENKFKEVRKLYEKAVEHTRNPDEGDQLGLIIYFNDGLGIPYTSEKDRNGYLITITYQMHYYTTLEQEKALRSQIKSIVSGLRLSGKTEYEKVRAIYNWICANVVYDHARLNDDSYKLKFTAYNAVMERNCVCSGYAQLFYRMALTAGLEARIEANYDHAWNLVRIGSKYYYCDSTWDAGKPESQYDYFLKGNWDFEHHHQEGGVPKMINYDQLFYLSNHLNMSLEAYGK